jgi:hypothetical protein
MGHLLPAELKVLEACAKGEIASIGKDRPAQKTAENEVRGGFMRFLALGGDERASMHEKGLSWKERGSAETST